jgi:Mn-containing catalase
VLYLLYKAKVLDYVFPSRNTADTLDYVVGQENIHEINFEQAIGSALEQGDFRLAIRLQYLKILKLLTVKELIHWKPNLTNQSYVQELEKTSHHSDFTEITRYFEFAWYGDFEVSEDGFKEMKAFSDSFVRKVGA